jgi:hypothetical protein
VEIISLKNGAVLQKYRKTLDASDESLTQIVQQSDLVAGVYEGGFKLWECAIDLLNFFVENSILFEGKRVLEVREHQFEH